MINVDSPRRFTRAHPCPICKGYDNMPRGAGVRCAGFVSADGQYVHCQRPELAGGLQLVEGSATYAHRAAGPCRCGAEHAPAPADVVRIRATYDYLDAGGKLLFQVVRKDPKGFSQRRPDLANAWIWNMRGVTPVLYRLNDLIERIAETVYVVEGEKDADLLRDRGLLATCNPMGAGKWRKEYTETLRGRRVILICDSDNPGRQHGRRVAAELAGAAASVRMLDLAPQRSDGYDVGDWLAEGHDVGELAGLLDAAALVPAAAALAPLDGQAPASPAEFAPQVMTARELQAKEFPEPRWAYPGVVPEGVSLLVGPPKAAKSWMALELVQAIATGARALGLTEACEAGRALYLALEDGERLLQRRLNKHRGADPWPERLHIATAWRRFDEGGRDDLDAWLTAHPDTRLVVIDTLARVRPRDVPGSGIYRQDYEALAPLTDLAHKHAVGIIVVHHTRKMGSDDALDLVSGSNGLAGACDAVLILQRTRLGDEGVLTVTGRDVEEQALACTFDRDTCRWEIQGEASAVQLSQLQAEILDMLAEEPAPLRSSEIADRLGRMNDSSLRHILCKMVKEGLLCRSLRGLYSAVAGALAAFAGRKGAAQESADTIDHVDDVIGCDLVIDRDRRDRSDNGDPVLAPRSADHKRSQDHNDHMRSQSITNGGVVIDVGELRSRRQADGPRPPAEPCPSCGRSFVWTPAPYDETRWICKRCGVEPF